MNGEMRGSTINQRFTGFYVHLVVFFVINFGLFLLNALVYPFTLWFYFPLLMWAVAVMIHACAICVEHEEVWNEKSMVEIVRKGIL